MERRISFVSQRSFPEVCQYVQTDFFPRLRQLGVGAVIQPLPPRIVANDPYKFVMTKVIEKRVTVSVDVERSPEGHVFVTLASRFRLVPYIVPLIISIPLTCGILTLIIGVLTIVKYSRWNTAVERAANLLRADLGV